MSRSPHELADMAAAASRAALTLTYAEEAFGFLATLHGDQDHVGSHAFEALCQLCHQGVKFRLDQDNEAVAKLAAELRNRAEDARP